MFAILIVALAGAEQAWAHGFKVTIDANHKLQLVSEDPTAGGLPLYKVQSLFGGATLRETDHPGFEAFSGFVSGDTISFSLLGPLWFSPGAGTPVPAAAGNVLSLAHQDGSVLIPPTVTGSSGPQAGFQVGEYDGFALSEFEHQLGYKLENAGGLPTGAFAVALRLLGTDHNAQPFTPSEPFVAIFNVGLTPTTLAAVAPQLYASAVPEPSSMVLAAAAAAGLAMAVLRRRKK